MKLLLACLLGVLALPAHALRLEKLRVMRPASAGGGAGDIAVVSGAALARFDVALDSATRRAALAQRGMKLKGEVGPTGWTHVALPDGMSVSAGLSILQAVPGVLAVEPDHAYTVKLTPNDPFFSQQWHLAKIDAPAAWEYGVGDSTRVTVAVIDVGIDGTHPDLSGKLVGTSQFCTPGANQMDSPGSDADDTGCVPDNPPTPACNHATRVAGVAAASSNNGIDTAGVSWGAKLLSLRVFRTQDCNSDCSDSATDSPFCSSAAGTPCCSTDDEAIIQALEFARQANNQPTYGRIVVNMSLGEAGNFDCSQHAPLQNEINFATGGSTGVVIAVATGNESTDVTVPASCNGVIPVGATDSNDNPASFSNSGPALAVNGVVAPGVGLTTTDLGGGVTGGATGTSFATPIVAGLAALILADKPALKPTDVQNVLRGSADSIGLASVSSSRPASNSVGAGRVNAFRAAKLAVEGTLVGFEGDQKVIVFPNPFRTSEAASVTISVPPGLQGQSPRIRVYGIDGQLVRDLKGQTTWDGRNDHGLQVASGVYLVLVKTGAGSQTTKVAVIR